METKKIPFFIRLKNAIVNFDEYKTFSEEKVSIAIKYILKLTLIFTFIIAIALTWKVVQEANILINDFKNECPEFSFQDDTLVIEGDNKKIVKGDESGYFGFIVDSEKEKLSDVEEAGDYQRVIAVLKDKVVIKNVDNIETSSTYKQLGQSYNFNNINKNSILQFLSGNDMTKIFAIFATISFVYLYVVYLVQMILDILLLSVVGYLFSKIIGIKFKYKSIFNMSVYALTLPVILYMIYIVVNLFTGFTIKYFEIAYNAIAYIYIITAMLMIKSDLIKQQIEVGKIIQEQKKIREEKKKEEEQEKEQPKDEKPKEDKKKKDKDKDEGQAPEGSKA